MLVLNRKKEESIIIGNDIKITVLEIRGDNVRIGIEAPRDVSVRRQEVYEAILREGRRSPPEPAASAAPLAPHVRSSDSASADEASR